MGSVEDRFMAKVSPEPNSGCWLWMGCDAGEGYGKFFYNGRARKAHRAAYELLVGEIPPGLQIDHLCRNPSCVNPDHLEPVTQRENMARGVAWERAKAAAARITHCPQGHAYAGGNLRIAKTGHRLCRACHRERELARYYSNKRSA